MKEKEKEKQSLKVVIVGNGKVGFSLAEQLVKEKYDVTIVDMREDSLRRASDALDIMSIRGNGVSAATLADAGAAEADLLVAATNSDEVNMVCCLTAKHMGAKFTIARIRNPEYSMGLNDLKKDLGIDMIINPENATAIEISRLLRFPSAANIQYFTRQILVQRNHDSHSFLAQTEQRGLPPAFCWQQVPFAFSFLLE